jgi:hypothetical protein
MQGTSGTPACPPSLIAALPGVLHATVKGGAPAKAIGTPFPRRGLIVFTSSGRHTDAISEVLTAAAADADHAPSVYDTRPWRWHATGDRLDLHLDRSRVLDITDPAARLGILSCGAALHHARVSVAAQGWDADVTRMPAPADPGRLATLRVTGKASVPVEAPAVRRAWTAGVRRSGDRQPGGPSVRSEHIDAITMAVEAEGGSLHVLAPDQVGVLATAAGLGRRAESGDTGWQHEMDYWTGANPRAGAGTPDAVIASRGGHRGDPRLTNGHDPSAKFAILYGSDDRPQAWLRAGEAFSAAWLTAVEIDVSVLPLSATIEMIGARRAMRVVLASFGFPYLVLRVALMRR